MVKEKKLPPKKQFSAWYHELIRRILIDQRYPLTGFLAYRPHGYELFTRSIAIVEDLLAASGHKKVYFPALIPERLLGKEEHHIAGYRDAVFWVTHGGLKPLEEKAALRPTSETAMYEMLKLWIRSWRDLPLRIHQSCSVYRYETAHTRPLIRDREILWNEAHTSHATAREAVTQVERGIQIYAELYRRLAIPVVWIDVVTGIFAGAEAAIEAYTVFPHGRALEMGSVNNLGQRFSRAFDIKFKTEDGKEDFVYQTCYGVSERLLAALVAVHGDDRGLILPPEVAPIQIVIVPIIYEQTKKQVLAAARKLRGRLRAFRTELDDREGITPGEKFYIWEMAGVPLRAEIGPQDMRRGGITLVRRDTGKKEFVKTQNLPRRVNQLFADIYKSLLARAERYHKAKIKNAKSITEIKRAIAAARLARIRWCGSLDCASDTEKAVNAPFIGKGYKEAATGRCAGCGNMAKFYAYVGKMY